jgi:hypothetical protein
MQPFYTLILLYTNGDLYLIYYMLIVLGFIDHVLSLIFTAMSESMVS